MLLSRDVTDYQMKASMVISFCVDQLVRLK